ncbi:MAG TPA: anaerobic ribonucleoside-triphosphate reductase, partial [Candidatus Nanoarchaeia archaeon]|nr:anaerobic ribonucleoside-triphosphate reductase [Candidatus Nanoarchaeia archaeon]
LEKKSENISTVISQIDADLQHKRTFQHIIHMAHPSALQKHMSGEIFIQNLRSPRLQNFVFGLDRINIHGTTGKVPKTLAEFFKDILYLANYVSSFTEPVFGIDGLNHYAAKFVKNLEKNQLVKEFTAFLEELAKLGRFYVSVELGKPRYVEDAEYDAKTSEELGKILLNIMAKANQNIYPIVKIWDKKRLRDDFSFLPRFYLVNMLPKWQTDNVSIVGESRFDYSWRGLYGTGKVGEMQNIAVNLPRLALKSKNTEEFMKNLELLISECIECHLNMMELTVGEFLRKHKTLLPSGTRGHWRIVAASDCSYAVSIAGLNEVLEILRKKGGKNIDPNTVLKHCLSSMKVRDATPIRLVLREDCDETITKRFYELDSRSFPEAKSSKQYSVGVACGDFEEGGHCHKLLLGGHVHKMSKQEYLKALTKLDKTEFGCIFVK